ncbi:protein kinase [Myxococcota bacterium]|nr:protein kinase [Myxococcota bacterium]
MQSDSILARLPVDLAALPPDVLNRLVERSRAPDRRLMVGRYVITGELGRGGMGVVYDAWDPGIERRVAIKTIEPDLVPEEDRDEVIERFRRETKIVGRLHHPGIVTIFDYGEERDQTGLGSKLYYYVMEHLEGQSLARVLRERRMLPDVEAVTIVANVLEALHVSHTAGVIHRDIKPSNIFLRNGREAVILDFGIAKTGSVALTRQGQILGTPSYLAPERLREKEIAVDGRADIFSLGVLLFTMLTGEAPFVGEDVYDVIDKIAKASHPKLARTTPAGQALSRVIDKMLAKKPDDRYPNASEAAAALRQVLALLRQSTPDLGDLLTNGVRVRDEIPEGATEIATPSSALHSVGDEEDTGRHHVAPVAPARTSSEALPGIAQTPAEILGLPRLDAATEIAPSESPVRIADLLGTVPEIALQRETREIGRSPVVAPRPEVTSVPAYSEGHEGDSGEYEPHAEHNDETTDDQTIADPDAVKKSLGELARLAQQGGAVSRTLARPTSLVDKSPSGPVASAPRGASGPVAVVAKDKSPPGGSVIPSAAKTPSGPNVIPPLGRTPSRSRDERQTEQIVRATSPDHSEQKTEGDRGRPSVRPVARPAQKSRRSRIEASLVDEDDVVVKPAPLDALKPDELPTQTGFRIPASITAPVAEDVAAEPDRVPDPAETSGEARAASDDGEVELETGTDSMPELDLPRSAAVARRTFGARGARDGRAPASKAPSSAPVQVRVSGTLAADRVRLVQRRGFLLLIAMLAAIGVGLFFGKMKQRAQLDAPEQGDAPKPIVIEPKVSRPNSGEGQSEPELVKPRPASEIIQDAAIALTEQKYAKAEELFERASRAAPERSKLRGQAMLGQADALRQQGKKDKAVELYRAVMTELPKSAEADEAKVALGELGVSIEPAPTRRDVAPTKAPATVQSAPVKEATPEVAQAEVTAAMSPEEKCRVVAGKHLKAPDEAVRALTILVTDDPRATCAYWYMGVAYSKLGDDRSALGAYRRFLQLSPSTEKRAAVEERIKNLAAKLDER